jgi:hypothetical protein
VRRTLCAGLVLLLFWLPLSANHCRPIHPSNLWNPISRIIEGIKSRFICMTRQSSYQICIKARFCIQIYCIRVITHVNWSTNSERQESVNNFQSHDISSTRDFVCCIGYIEVLTVSISKSLLSASSELSQKSCIINHWRN